MIDPDLLTFLRTSVRSVWALELLLLMRRDPDRAWTVEDLVRELRGSTTVVADALDTFRTAGLVAPLPDERFAYAPASAVTAELCDAVERLYRERPVAVVNAIVSSPKDKLQTFADAFRLKDPSK